MNKVTKNIIANYLGKLWGFISIFLFVRLYIDILGIESYAIINFYTVILGLLAFADAGLTATLTRELARNNNIETKSNLVFTFERIYLCICLILIMVIALSSNIMSQNFLASKTYPPETVAHYLRLIGIGVALQLFSTLYEGGLNGLQYQVLTNKVRITWGIFRTGIVLIPLYFFPHLDIYFWWQILCNLILLFVFRYLLYSLLPNAKPVFSKKLLKSTSKYALGMMGIAFISAINIQIDKLVTSKYLSMEEFGFYSIASTLAQLPTLVVIPIVVAVFPLLSMLISQQDIESTEKIFHKYSFLIACITTPIVLCIGLYATQLITLWTGRGEIALSIDSIVRFLLVGGLFLCLQLTPFYLALANGFTKINLYSGIIGLIFIVPMMIYAIKNYGMIGVTFPWIFINVMTFFIMGIYVVRRFLNNQVFIWLFWDIFIPILVTVVIVIIVEFMLRSFTGNYIFIIKSMIIGLCSLFLNLYVNSKKFPDNVLVNFASILNKVQGKLK